MYSNLIYFIFGLLVNICSTKKYSNFSLYRGIPVNQLHMQFFKEIGERFNVNFWTEPRAMYEAVDFVIAPENKKDMLNTASSIGVYITLIVDDVQAMFDNQTIFKYVKNHVSTMNWNHFYELEDIYRWLTDLSQEFPKEIKIEVLGHSHEGRDILAARVALTGCSFRSIVIIEGGIHAREWISVSVATYLLNEIIRSASSEDTTLKYMASLYEWYFIPVLNPDGYEYTHTTDRLWRKNRNGEGVDLNRNFDNAFGSLGTSKLPNVDTYCGPHPFSENETQAIAKFVHSKGSRIEYYISFHSYGQYMIIPYSYSTQHLANYDQVFKICKEVAASISSKYNTRYKIGNAFETVGYPVSGTSMGWVKATYHVPFVLTFELRDQGDQGFAISPSQITPTCQEIETGLLVLLTPRQRHMAQLVLYSSSQRKYLDKIVIFLNIFLVILVRFD